MRAGYLEAEQTGKLNAWLYEHLGKSEKLAPGTDPIISASTNTMAPPTMIPPPTSFRISEEPEDPAEQDTFVNSLSQNMAPQLLPCQQLPDSRSNSNSLNPAESRIWQSDPNGGDLASKAKLQDPQIWNQPIPEITGFNSKSTSDSDQTVYGNYGGQNMQQLGNVPTQNLAQQNPIFSQMDLFTNPQAYGYQSKDPLPDNFSGYFDPGALGKTGSIKPTMMLFQSLNILFV